MTPGLLLRPARVDEAGSLAALCTRACAAWGAAKAAPSIDRDAVATHRVFVVERAGELLGVAQLQAAGREAVLDVLVVAPESLGRGVGRLLYAWALGAARAHGARTMRVPADARTRGFYERMGAHPVAGKRQVLRAELAS